MLINLTRGGADDDVRAADAPLAVPDGAGPPLQLRDLVDEADALDERPALPAPAARSRALGHLLTLMLHWRASAGTSSSPHFSSSSRKGRKRISTLSTSKLPEASSHQQGGGCVW